MVPENRFVKIAIIVKYAKYFILILGRRFLLNRTWLFQAKNSFKKRLIYFLLKTPTCEKEASMSFISVGPPCELT